MLILSRKENQQIVIDGHIKITVIGIHDSRVRIGIEAPKDVPVHRLEVQEEIDERKAA